MNKIKGACMIYVGGDSGIYNYKFKFNNKNNRIKCEICSKLTIKTV